VVRYAHASINGQLTAKPIPIPEVTLNCVTRNCAGTVTLYRNRHDDKVDFFVQHDLAEGSKPEDLVFKLIAEELQNNATLDWKYFDQSFDMVEVKYYSEYNRDQTIFRSHNYYRSIEAWHDWVMLRWSEQNPTQVQKNLLTEEKDTIDSLKYGDRVVGNRYCYTPCKILGMFFHVKTNGVLPEEHFAVVWPTSYDFKRSSIFSTKWTMDYIDNPQCTIPKYAIVNCNSIVRHSLMIPQLLSNEKLSKFYHEIWPRDLWGDQF